jgi:hypothetical protein
MESGKKIKKMNEKEDYFFNIYLKSVKNKVKLDGIIIVNNNN